MDYLSPLCPEGGRLRLTGPFQKFGSFAFGYIAATPALDSVSDSPEAPMRSNTTVCEDNRMLGPGHSVHRDIGTKGQGRFSHWKDLGIVFSASDNSDPNTNGRSYWAVQHR
jgi:hypothetical protein